MSTPSLLAFSLAMFILAATPGPGVFATVASALASGFKKTVPLIVGIVIGDIVYLLFAVFGLSLIARTMADLFTVIRLIGGGYLIYLGVKIWRTAPEENMATERGALSSRRNFLSGLVITLSNPKVIIFYCGFLPTFVDLTSLNGPDLGLIVLLVSVVLGLVLCSYSFAAARSRLLLQSTRAIRNLNRGAGTVMAATGAVIATRT